MYIRMLFRYDFLPYQGKGLMVAQRPWDGSYNVSDTIWALAHTTQFTERGWFYVGGSARGLLPGGGSFVTYVSPEGSDVTLVIESVGATESQTLRVTFVGQLTRVDTLSHWTTTEGSVFIVRYRFHH
eukprot:m.115291 g.115291  ORF g.115291 m.115291 type:complete len:127 (+) comp17142_c0_seq8:198-578(+)